MPCARLNGCEVTLKVCLGVQEVEIVNVLISQHFTLQVCQLGSGWMLCLGRE